MIDAKLLTVQQPIGLDRTDDLTALAAKLQLFG
jgi:hypothetical protein